jgi:hypothetical protein
MIEFAPRIANANDRAVLEDMAAEPLRAKTAAVREPPTVGAIEPIPAPEF